MQWTSARAYPVAGDVGDELELPESGSDLGANTAAVGRQTRTRDEAAGDGSHYRHGMPDNEVMDFDERAERGSRHPRGVYNVGRDPDPLYTLANERTYLSWLRLAVTLLAGAVAIDRLFLERPRAGSQILTLGLVVIAFGTCGLAVRRWWAAERALRLRRPLPGFGAPLLGIAAIVLVGVGIIVLVVTPRG